MLSPLASVQVHNPLSISRNSLLLPPNSSDCDSRIAGSRHTNSIGTVNRQPQLNPHTRFLSRTEDKCPQTLSEKQQQRWLKTGEKARANQALSNEYEIFNWPISRYEPPIHLHHQTPIDLIISLQQKLNHIHLYTIDTECDKPTKEHPHSVPALIQIQAICNEEFSLVLLIEVQHLPPQNTALFQQIQQLCHYIFSPSNQIMAWGNVIREMTPFIPFSLFDINQITNRFNIQNGFTNAWNETHPHTPECLNDLDQTSDDESHDILICLVNSDDLDNDIHPTRHRSNLSKCTCPDWNRPYKDANEKWALQKAIQFSFGKALDKSHTLNTWSCGLDDSLRTWNNSRDRKARESLILYAINDIFAPTQLYFHFNQTESSHQPMSQSVQLATIKSDESNRVPLLFLFSDSHCKRLSPEINTSRYQLNIRAISGLQWVNPYNRDLCARTFLTSSLAIPTLSMCTAIVFLIGTNSVRNTLAVEIIEQIEEIVTLIRHNYPQLMNKFSITMILTFPCNKPSSTFPMISQLHQNIESYNHHLKLLAERMQFSVVDLKVTEDYLGTDRMHLQIQHQRDLQGKILALCDHIIHQKDRIPKLGRRSQSALKRRNKKRHMKRVEKQRGHTLIRLIHPTWKLPQLRQFLKMNQINFTRLPDIYNHRVKIQFDNDSDLQDAEKRLFISIFQEKCHMV